ncbi:MAG: cbb3-type cytochrome c oxidase N-terminal domain-containing protein [Nibricoccus sp.]
MTSPANNQPPQEDPVRHHTFDGIQEYDRRLPNWWLLTFYGAIVFAVVYWFYFKHSGVPIEDGPRVEQEIAQIEAARLASGAVKLTDAELWKMSRNPVVVESGKAIFTTNCVACHLASLKGKAENPSAVGASLIGTKWITGGNPLDLINTVTKGTQRGMQPWGPVLGTKKISEVVAYVLSFHTEGEPIEIVNSPAAGVK